MQRPRATWLAITALLLFAASAPSQAERSRRAGDVRTRQELAQRVRDLSAYGTVLAAVVTDTGKDPGFRPGTFSPTRSVSVKDAAVLRVVDGELRAEPLGPGRATVLYPSSLWSDGTPVALRPAVSERVLIAAQRVGDMWVAFPESPACRIARNVVPDWFPVPEAARTPRAPGT